MKKYDVYICLSDIKHLVIKNRFALFLAFFCTACLTFLYALFATPMFQIEATFVEKNQNTLAKNAMIEKMMGTDLNLTNVLTLFKSKALLEKVIAQSGYQMQPMEQSRFVQLGINFYDNLLSELAWYKNRYSQTVHRHIIPLEFKTVSYSGLYAKELHLVFISDDEFEVFETKKMGQGRIGVPFQGSDFEFTLLVKGSVPVKGKRFLYSIYPMEKAIGLVRSRLKVTKDKQDSNLILLSFKAMDPLSGVHFLNLLMDRYKVYLKEEAHRLSSEQLAFLDERKINNYKKLEDILSAYQQFSDSNLKDEGFLFLEDEVSAFQKPKMKMINRLRVIENELIHLENIENNPFFQSSDMHFSNHIHAIKNEIEGYRSRRDTVNLALKEHQGLGQKNKAQFEKELDEIKYEKTQLKESKKLLFQLLTNQPLSKDLYLLKNGPSPLLSWIESIEKQHDPKEKEGIKSYLENKIRLSQLRQKILNERLNFSQKVAPELQGIELETANTLYVQYRKDLEDIQLKIEQLDYALVQLKCPNFEISTLGTILNDPVSFSMVQQCAKLMLLLQDDQNRSEKDKKRLQHELKIQRNALLLHTKDSVELNKLKLKLIKEKITSIQQITLELLNQKIALLEQQLTNALISHKKSLLLEKEGIDKNLNILSRKMRHLPEKWTVEQKLSFEKKANLEILRSLAQIVESKNIEMHLNVAQSGPLDKAALPIRPQGPHIVLSSFMAGMFGFCVVMIYLIFTALIQGFPISFDNLSLRGEIAFRLPKEALLFFDRKLNGCKCITLIGADQNRIEKLKKLLKDQKLLFIESKERHKKEKSGHHLSVEDPSDLFLSKRLFEKIEQAKKEYDWIFICIDCRPLALDPHPFEKIANGHLVFVKDENIEHMQPYFDLSQAKAFLF